MLARRIPWVVVAALAGILLARTAQAADSNAGQEDLDKATKAKLAARSMDELDEVIRLCEQAQQKGLDKDNTAFAQQMLSSTLVQRGLIRAKVLFDNPAINLGWPQVRKARQQAMDDLERGVKLDPQQPEALIYIARMNLLPDGDRKRAAACLDQAIEAAAENPAVKSRALLLRADLTTDPKKKLGDLEQALQLTPNDFLAVFGRATLLADLGQMDRALDDLDKAIKLEPDNAAPYEVKAIVLTRQKKYDHAMVALDKARELDRNSLFPLLQQARIHLLQENPNAALHDLELLLEKSPGNAEVLLMRAEIFQQIGQPQQAMSEINTLLKLKADYAPGLRARAMLLASMGKIGDAIGELEALRAKSPKDTNTLLQLALMYASDKRSEQALAMYDAALKIDAKNFLALRGRGDLLLGVGKHQEAIAVYQQALALEPKDSALLNNLAWVLCTSPLDKVRDGKRAIELAAEACKLTEYRQGHILSTLAAAYAETGDFKTACEWSEKAVALGADEQKAELRKELASYQQQKPWRELQSGDDEKKTPAKPDVEPAKKPAAKKAPESKPTK